MLFWKCWTLVIRLDADALKWNKQLCHQVLIRESYLCWTKLVGVAKKVLYCHWHVWWFEDFNCCISDLVPKENVEAWLKYLRNDFPTVAFKASTQSQKNNLVSFKFPFLWILTRNGGKCIYNTCILLGYWNLILTQITHLFIFYFSFFYYIQNIN